MRTRSPGIQTNVINTGNQTVPLLRVQEFFTADADLSVIKSDNQDSITVITAGDDPVQPPLDYPVIPGETFTYTIKASNSATSAAIANSVVVYDVLDPDVTFLSASGGGFINTDSTDAIPDGAVQWNLGSLVQGQEALHALVCDRSQAVCAWRDDSFAYFLDSWRTPLRLMALT